MKNWNINSNVSVIIRRGQSIVVAKRMIGLRIIEYNPRGTCRVNLNNIIINSILNTSMNELKTELVPHNKNVRLAAASNFINGNFAVEGTNPSPKDRHATSMSI